MTIFIRLILIITVIFAVCSCSKKETSLKDTKLYNRTYSLLREGSDSTLSYISQIRKISNEYPTAIAYADYLTTWYYCININVDSIDKYSNIAIEEFTPFKQNKDELSDINLCLAEIELIQGYVEMEFRHNSKLARKHIEHSFNIFEQQNQIMRLLECNIYLSQISLLENDFTASLAHLQKMESIYKDLDIDSLRDDTKVLLLTDIAASATSLGYYTIADNYLNLASTYYDKISDRSKLEYLFQRSIAQLHKNEYTLVDYTAQRIETIAKKINNKEMLSRAYVMMGLALSRMDLNDDAQSYRNKADSIYFATPEISVINEKRLLDGELAAKSNMLETSYTLLFDSTFYAKYIYHINTLLESQKTYFLVQGNYQKAYELDKQQRDNMILSAQYIIPNIFNRDTNTSDINGLQNQLKNQDNTINDLKQYNNYERTIFVTIIIIIAIIIVIYKRKENARNKKKVEVEYNRLKNEIDSKVKELEHQKEILQQCNTRIAESISYAERIQHSIMPFPEQLNQYQITGSFIFHSPLDVVSGDFYWFTQKGDNLIVCCADCTGHGVPGAFMSMIASTILTDICNKSNNNILPSEILTQLDEKLIENLAHNRTESGASKDGLDISIVSINLKTKKVVSSAARRPIIIIKDQDILHIQGTKRSIGDTEDILRSRNFTDTETQLHTNDVIYMYTDGYSDQFGGSDGAKMKNTKIKKFLRAIHDDDMDEQSLTVQELFTQWKGDYPQTDDVLFIGIKL